MDDATGAIISSVIGAVATISVAWITSHPGLPREPRAPVILDGGSAAGPNSGPPIRKDGVPGFVSSPQAAASFPAALTAAPSRSRLKYGLHIAAIGFLWIIYLQAASWTITFLVACINDPGDAFTIGSGAIVFIYISVWLRKRVRRMRLVDNANPVHA